MSPTDLPPRNKGSLCAWAGDVLEGAAAEADAAPEAAARTATATPVTAAGKRWDTQTPQDSCAQTGRAVGNAVGPIGPARRGIEMAGSNVVVTDHKAPLATLVGRIDRDQLAEIML